MLREGLATDIMLILSDINMPGMNGVEATRRLHDEMGHIRVIGLSMYEEPHRVREMKNAGAVAYISKGEAAERVVKTIHACAAAG